MSVLLALAIATGCGGSDDISKEDFAQQANAACKKANDKAAAEFSKLLAGPEFEEAKSEAAGIRAEVTELVPVLIDEAKTQRSKMEELGLPKDGEAEIEAMLDAYSSWIKKAEASPLKIVIANDIFNQARELAKKQGLQECSLTPFTPS
jgi:hypothetical protein